MPKTTLVAIENTHNKCGGRALPLDWLEKLGAVCKELKLPVHCDGARLFNAAVSQKKQINELLAYVDSASICLSKVKITQLDCNFRAHLGSGVSNRLSNCWFIIINWQGIENTKSFGWRYETGLRHGNWGMMLTVILHRLECLRLQDCLP